MSKLNIVGRKGAYNEERQLIIPFDYAEINALSNNVYCARKTFKESEYFLYTEKGLLNCPIIIKIVQWDNKGNLFAIGDKCKEFSIVEVDYKNNSLNIIYQNSITRIAQKTKHVFLLTVADGRYELFSRQYKKVIASFDKVDQLVKITEKGFILKDEYGDLLFYDLSGKKILDSFAEIKLYDKHIVAYSLVNGKAGLYSYSGEMIFPIEYIRYETEEAITPILTEIDGEKTWVFKVYEKTFVGKAIVQAVRTIDGKPLIWTDLPGQKICIFKSGNAIRYNSAKKNDVLYKLEKDENGKIRAKLLCDATQINRIYDTSYLFEVRKGCKYGVCDENGHWVKRLKWRLFKPSFARRSGDIDH